MRHTALITVRRAPKTGTTMDECEDATHPAQDATLVLDPLGTLVAVADGATSYSYSKEWAHHVCAQPNLNRAQSEDGLLERLPQWQAEFQGHVNIDALPWYAAEKAQMGAFCTLLAVVLMPQGRDGPEWRALAVGDSCFVHLRDGRVVDNTPFPIRRAEDFSSRTHLLPSRSDLNVRLHGNVHVDRGGWQPGDEWLLMTDALGAWFLGEQEAGRDPLRELSPHFTPRASVTPTPLDHASEARADATENSAPLALIGNILADQYGTKGSLPTSPRAPVVTEDGVEIVMDAGDEMRRHGEAFADWAEELKRQGVLKDDDVTFVHVRVVEEG